MGLLDTIKSALGIGASRDQEPDPGSERAVKEPVATSTEASGSTAPVTEEPSNEDDTAVEHTEATGDVSDQTETEQSAAEPAETTDPAPEAGEEGHQHVESVSGIGPAYANRLADAGVESVDDLATADADALAEETGISAKRIGRWIERAEEF
ncbi:hypothetical protein BRD04_08480 [Halobacteriales archaeon QS_9_67_17]|nr:MAG: hypothetical protein BRD04_08480 [Halobacteriales archaeon QS_9_67_17]